MLDSSVQKGFLYGINGTIEHIFSIDSLLANARSKGQAIIMDLKNAFGSVCHQYLFDIFQYIKIPSAIVSYVMSCNS